MEEERQTFPKKNRGNKSGRSKSYMWAFKQEWERSMKGEERIGKKKGGLKKERCWMNRRKRNTSRNEGWGG